MERQKHQSEYLRAMGVDIYVQRPASDMEADALGFESEVITEDAEEAPSSSEMVAKSSPLKSEDILKAEPEVEVAGQQVKDDSLLEEEPADIGIAIEPLHFLWQQTDSSLMLSVQIDQPTDQHARLLQAIAASLRPSNLQGGSGKWPLTDAQKTTEIETQQFLSSFVQGRSEQTGSGLKLILFGEQSLSQFPNLEGGYQQLIGKVLPGVGKISEFRLVPSLEDMLADPKSKSLTWQNIRDLAGS
ncbi:MAG: hypothetical protein HOL48_01260 [Porticoccaceae bacterium]|nr:hypothetical protein [Porticoccaceae bacterium]